MGSALLGMLYDYSLAMLMGMSVVLQLASIVVLLLVGRIRS